MVFLEGNLALGCGPGTHFTKIDIFQYELERTDAIMKTVLEQITFILTYPTLYIFIEV